MERITGKRTWEEAKNNLANEMGYSYIWQRLNKIEGILGDSYNLERLKELMEADKEGKVHICQKTTSNRYSQEKMRMESLSTKKPTSMCGGDK